MLILVSISLILFSAYASLIGYYHRAWKKIPDYVPDSNTNNSLATKVSVIIPVRNEEKNIKYLLDCIFNQSYPKNLFQVIVVNDHSTDNTWNIISTIYYNEMNLRCLNLADYSKNIISNSYKKSAIEIAIGESSGDLIVTTDADCEPQPDWLLTIAAFHQSSNAKFIAAPVKINSTRSFLSVFQTLDFITLQGITGASVFKNMHSMCNGANLAYEKKAFKEVQGFRDIEDIPSGDDMLLMYKIYKKYPDKVFFLKNKNAVVSTLPETSWVGFFNRRIRWASKADKYDDKRIFWTLLLVYVFNLLFAVLLIVSFRNKTYLILLLILLLLKLAIEYPFVKSAARFFNQQKLMAHFALMQPFHIIYIIVIGLFGKLGGYRWKGRKIN